MCDALSELWLPAKQYRAQQLFCAVVSVIATRENVLLIQPVECFRPALFNNIFRSTITLCFLVCEQGRLVAYIQRRKTRRHGDNLRHRKLVFRAGDHRKPKHFDSRYNVSIQKCPSRVYATGRMFLMITRDMTATISQPIIMRTRQGRSNCYYWL